MDPILSAKPTSLSDAFSMLLAIWQGPDSTERGNIHKRSMLHNQHPFIQYSFHNSETNVIDRWLTAEFRQADGFFYLYTHTDEEMQPYQAVRVGSKYRGFDYKSFVDDAGLNCTLHTIHDIERAARDAAAYLCGFMTRIPLISTSETRQTMQRIIEYKNYHDTTGRRVSCVSDLGKTMER